MPKPALIIAGLMVSTAAMAHPGHGQSTGLAHYLIEPFHVLGGAALALAVVVGMRALRRRHARAAQ